MIPEFQDFLLSPPLVPAKNTPFYAHNKKKENRNCLKCCIEGRNLKSRFHEEVNASQHGLSEKASVF
jgi:hypothetical protein